MSALNKNNSAVKRIMQEARELANDPCTDYSAAPLEDDIFEWHCTLRGPAGTEFEGGLYHFRILLPAEYPFRPPAIMMLTPNGRFELNTKICISFTNYHEELWQPAWGVRTAIIGLQGFFPLKGQAAVGVGSIEYPASERKRLAALAREWTCPHCKESNVSLLPDPPTPTNAESKENTEEAEHPESTPTPETETPSNDSTNSSDVAEISDVTNVVQSRNGLTIALDGISSPIQPSPITGLSSRPQSANLSSMDRGLPHPSPSPVVRLTTTSSTRSETPPTPMTAQSQVVRRSTQKPPVLLDTAICILLVLLFAIICRRVV